MTASVTPQEACRGAQVHRETHQSAEGGRWITSQF
jgi:hypothetical protein